MSGGGIPLVNVGDVLAGKYQVDRVLGIGGMGMVVAATHVELDQKVAIKFMLPTALANTSATERFLREARAVVKLRSEHVCRVFDVGRLTDGAPYIVMELMDGLDLSQVLETRRILPVAEAVDLVMQALEGIAEAHANGIVHRDLKPANLFLATDSDGSPLVKVLDFGISKSSVGGSATKTGEIMGSPSYMAPEQMQSSKDVDQRADIWAIGVILYEATTGVLPFASENLPALCMQVMFDPVPPMQGVSPAFAAVIMRSLAKAAAERYDDLGAFAMALAPYGTSDAAAGASRIVKVLRRSKGPDASATPWTAKTVALRPESTRDSQPPSASQVSSTNEAPAGPVAAAASAVRQSTLSGSASESLRVGADRLAKIDDLDGLDAPAPRPRWMLPAAFVGAAAVAVIAVVAVTSLTRSHRDATIAPAAAPPAVTDPSTPAPAGSATAEVPPAPPPATAPVSPPTTAPVSPTTAPVSPPPPTTAATATPPPAATSAPVADSTHKTSTRKTATSVRASSTSATSATSATSSRSATSAPSTATAAPPPVTRPPPPTTTAATPPPVTPPPPPPAGATTGSAATGTTPDGKPIYKGTKGKIITTYPTE